VVAVERDTALTTKWCGGCHRDLPLDAFARNRTHASGRQTRCRECMAVLKVNPMNPLTPAWGHLEPIQLLGRAVIDRAVKDAQGVDIPAAGMAPDERRAYRARIAREARAWLGSVDLACWLDATFSDESVRREAVWLIDRLVGDADADEV